jgi:hypothetical protein
VSIERFNSFYYRAPLARPVQYVNCTSLLATEIRPSDLCVDAIKKYGCSLRFFFARIRNVSTIKRDFCENFFVLRQPEEIINAETTRHKFYNGDNFLICINL